MTVLLENISFRFRKKKLLKKDIVKDIIKWPYRKWNETLLQFSNFPYFPTINYPSSSTVKIKFLSSSVLNELSDI